MRDWGRVEVSVATTFKNEEGATTGLGSGGQWGSASLLVAESFSIDAWQRVHLHDVCDGIVVRALPARRRLCACAKVWALPPGEHQARLLLIEPDGGTLAAGSPSAVQPDRDRSSCTVLTAFSGVHFRSAGRHEVALEVDGRTVATIPLEVAVRADADGGGAL